MVNTKKNKILLADDSSVNNLLLQDILEEKGFKVTIAESGKIAFKILKKEIPDLILLDIMMPFMDGFEVLKRLKTDINTKDIPVIMVTAKNTQYDRKRAEELGAINYIVKPIDIAKTIKIIKDTLS